MKLAEHVERIRQNIDKAFRNRFGRMGISSGAIAPLSSLPNEYIEERKRIETIREVFIAETGSVHDAYEKLVEEFTFTLFNRMAALKVMEAHTLHPEIITRRSQHSDRSFAHNLWLDNNPDGRSEDMEGLLRFMVDQLTTLALDIPLFSPDHPYHLLPTAIEFNSIINAFNTVERDEQVETDIWKSDDVLGWLYESYNNYKKAAHKESGDRTEYNKVSIQSQVYTPRWVVKFLVDNSLGKLYLEMYPDSSIKEKYRIANAPTKQTRKPKSLKEVRLIDPATGSGNFLLYAFDLFYDLYQDQIDNYGAGYNEDKISDLIIRHNLHGIDLDDRAIQLAQLGLYIKAKRKKRSTKIDHFNIVSSDFYLPKFDRVKYLFENGEPLRPELEKIVTDLWEDLQQAYKFGALIRLDEKFSKRLEGLVQQFEKAQLQFFSEETLANYEQFKDNFFNNLQKAVERNAEKQGLTFLTTKTQDAITFLEVLTRKYDVAVANPPYTDSGDFGPELKKFIESNYKHPYKFNTNLYATFIKRCCDIVDETGKVALVHPPTFMYITTFEEVRRFMVDRMHISLFVEWGYLGMFNPSARVDSAMYILEKENSNADSHFIKLSDLYEGKRYEALVEAYEDLLKNRTNAHNYIISQSKFKIIEAWPFIYWISDDFREKFKESKLEEVMSTRQGGGTGDNNRCLRLWWEVSMEDFSTAMDDGKKWKIYQKGGPYCKWFGNNWIVIGYDKVSYDWLKSHGNCLPSERYYFMEGITFCRSGSKGTTFRYMPPNHIISGAGPGIYFDKEYKNIFYTLGFLNSSISFYLINCLNPTVNNTEGDIKRIPFVMPSREAEEAISKLVYQNIQIKAHLNSFRLIETTFAKSPLLFFSEASLRDRLISYLTFENAQMAIVLINESIINDIVFDVYGLTQEDREQVEDKMGKQIGGSPVLEIARKAFCETIVIDNEIVQHQIENLAVAHFDQQRIQEVNSELNTLYQSNNDIEEFCIRNQVNPINVWYWFKESRILPEAKSTEIAIEFLADAFRNILMEDKDGIVPLVALPNESRLLDRLEQHCLNNGFTSAQFMQLDGLLGKPIDEYIENYFFKNFCDHLNLFMYLPKTPFIWHLSSGEHQGFEAFIIIYKWDRDSLFKLKTKYLSKRVENLEYRQIQLASSDTAQAMNEKEAIRLQLEEIKIFTQKIDELIAEGYHPKLDDGVGKNIAPLQKKGLLRTEVLNKKQLEKYLNADW